MRQGVVLALVGGAVFAAVAVATLPASLITSRLPPQVVLDGVAGSIWSGSAEHLTLQGSPLGTLTWDAHPAALLGGRLEYSIELTQPAGYVRGRVALHVGGAIDADDVDLALPITALNRNPAANAWQGDLAGHVVHARLEGGWPVAVDGKFTMSKLRPPGAAFDVGSYALEFEPSATTAERLVGRVRDVNAPLEVRAQLAVQRERSYVLEGEVTPKPGAPPDIANAIAFLGPPDAAGRRSFTITGTF